MNLEPTEEQLSLRATVRRFLQEKASVADHVRPLLDDPTGMTDAGWLALAELGTTGLLVPADHGGAGMTMVEAGVVLEELGAGLHPGPWLSSAVAATRALTRVPTAGETGKLLAGIADGSTIATVGPLEPAAPRPAATATADGDAVTLRGEIAQIADAAAADVLLVLASDDDGTGLYAVDTSSPYVAVTPRRSIDQTRKVFRVTLHDAPARRLGPAPAEAIQALVDDVLVASAADALGAARALLDLTVAHAKVRRQFGQPVGAFQAVAHLCVDMYETVELARGGVLHALWAADAATPAQRHRAALRAKAFAGRLATVGDTAIQVFGGLGYTWEHDSHLYLKRLLSWSALLGGPDSYLREVGSQLVHELNPQGADHEHQ
ncbi:acyl-CoA dehydrogenase family protein [Pseudofrankia sp. BMG5.37]|uniref:acyl-CoA dehydrogenase family protein n=1 Tax=Pseudofrankia sp. BMG5.37 TaxID=3050035 RepID=UPI002895F200|nr:acyl-CoA dehydrogenase family protein [Pseudofrankia sp. BMG5.37]MDT3440858.1 acyl-CoA dehydrogenase family protein [Pseudofrankia sp. BMG5.37]